MSRPIPPRTPASRPPGARSVLPSGKTPGVVPRGSHRRSAHRVYLRTGVLLRDLRGRTQEGVTGNLGEGGIFVHAPAPFPSGSRLRIRIDLGAAEGGGPVELEGRVTWVRRQGDRRLPGYGVRFTQIDPADRDRIRRLLDMRAVESRHLWMS